jgi:hypothetical protein
MFDEEAFARTDELQYSSNSLSSSSISVYATLMCETGRSKDDRAARADEKNDCVFALWNISTPDSSGVIGVMACCTNCVSAHSRPSTEIQIYHGGGLVLKRTVVKDPVVQML